MQKILDKLIVFAICLVLAVLVGVSLPVIVGVLLAIIVCCLNELAFAPWPLRTVALLFYVGCAFFVLEFAFFLPLIAFDLYKVKFLPLRFVWLLPILFLVALSGEVQVLAGAALFSTIAVILAARSMHEEQLLQDLQNRRDNLEDEAVNLELRNRDLRDRKDLELHLATLSERARIAREIHDNVGHLLTRSVLQVEALQVSRANDTSLVAELGQASSALHEAFEAIRASVHDLHDDASDLYAQLRDLVRQQAASLKIDLDYRCDKLPSAVAYTFLAIVREALSNSERHSDATCASITLVEFPGFYQLTVLDNGSRVPEILRERDGGGGSRARGDDDSARRVRERDDSGAANRVRDGDSSANRVRERDDDRDTEGRQRRKPGLGLKSMEERCRAFGGVFRISYEGGFKVFVTIPKEQN